MKSWIPRFALAALLLVTISTPAEGRDRKLEIEGLLANSVSPKKMERKVIRKGAGGGKAYRTLDGMYVIHVPSEASFEDQVAPALEAAIDSERPLESMTATMFSFDDADALLSGPEEPGVLLTFELPGERGEGFVGFTAPILIGPSGDVVNHTQPNKMRVVTGVYVEDADDDPIVEALGLKSTPDQWTGGDARLPKINPLPDDGEGAWVKYKGRSYDSGEDRIKRQETVEKIIGRDILKAGSMRVWPGDEGDREGVKDVLTSARYRTRVLEGDGKVSDILKTHSDDWEWDDKRVKHPTRYGISTLAINGEVEGDRGFDQEADIFVFVYFYTPLFIGFDEAHLYCKTSPEFFARSVQKGELPFFEVDDKMLFYRGHLDRWMQGLALDWEGGTVSRRSVEKVAEKWARDADSKDARAIQGMARSPNHWPLRMVQRDDDDDSDKTHKVHVVKQDLGNWYSQLRSRFDAPVEEYDQFWTLAYEGEANAVELGGVLRGGMLDMEEGAYAVASAPADSGMSRREEESLSRKERERIDEQREREEEAASEAEDRRRAEADEREADRRREDDRRREEDRAREELASRGSDIEVRLREVTVGTPAEAKPYLATRGGRTIPVKIAYAVDGDPGDTKLQVVSTVFDTAGEPVAGFTAKSSSVTPSEGEGATTTYLKVPSSLGNGSYRVLTRLEIDGIPAPGEREEFLHIGKPLQLHSANLDPAVVVPEEEVELLMDLQLGGWSVDDEVKLTVKLDYTVEGASTTDSFTLTRSIGYHELGIDMEIPEEIAAGDGTYKVTVSEPSGNSASASGQLTVFSKDLVASSGPRRSSGDRRRVDEDDDDPLAGMTVKKSDDDEEEDRDYVRASGDDDDDDDWDFDDVDMDEFEDVEDGRREERRKTRDDDRRRQQEEDRRRAQHDDRREAEQERARRAEEDA